MIKLALPLLLLALATGCAPDDASLTDNEQPETPGTALRVEVDGRTDIGDVPTSGSAPRPRPLPAACHGLQEVSSTLLESYQLCSHDAECVVEHVDSFCLGNFMCPVPVNGSTDRVRLRREAAALSFAYQNACTSTCPVASCAAPRRTYCDAATKRCKNDYQ